MTDKIWTDRAGNLYGGGHGTIPMPAPKCRYCLGLGFIIFLEGDAQGPPIKKRHPCNHPKRWHRP